MYYFIPIRILASLKHVKMYVGSTKFTCFQNVLAIPGTTEQKRILSYQISTAFCNQHHCFLQVRVYLYKNIIDRNMVTEII